MSNTQTLTAKLYTGLIWVLVLNVLVKPFWILVIEAGVQNAVGHEMYGFYIAIFNFSYIFNILLDLGITNYNTRKIAQQPELIDKHLSGILGVKIMLMGVYVVATFLIGWMVGYSTRQFYLLAWLSVNQGLNSLILYLRSNFEGLLLFKWDSVLSVLDRVLMIIICGGLLMWHQEHGGFEIAWFVYAQTTAYIATVAVALRALRRKRVLHRPRWDWAFVKGVMRQSLPFAVLVFLMATYNRIDPILLERLLPYGEGDLEAGIYAAAFRLLDALTMIAYMVSVPLLPIYSKLTVARRENQQQIAETTRQVFWLVWVIAVGASTTLSSMSEELMGILYDSDTRAIADVFEVLIYGIIPITATYVYGTLLTANGSLRQLNLFAAGALAVNVTVNLIVIPRYGAVGSAVASVTTQSVMAITQIVAAHIIFGIRPRWGHISKLGIFGGAMIGLNILCEGMAWWSHLTIAVTVAAIVLLPDIKKTAQLLLATRQTEKQIT